MDLSVEVIRSDAGLDGLRDDWNSLFDSTPNVSGFQAHAWINVCQRRLVADGSLFVGAVREGARAIAIFPVHLTALGRLVFIGRNVSNYSGPVYQPERLAEATSAWSAHMRAERAVKGIDLSGLRASSPFYALVRDGLHAWGRPLIVTTNSCPEVDLQEGWEALSRRHKSKQRSTWKRKATKLARLGELRFAEATDAAAVAALLPRMFELFERRWSGQRVKGFSSRPTFQREAALRMADAGHTIVSTLSLDGEVVAFAYGIRGAVSTSSYVLAHDERFHAFSPGLLLLLRMLEAAADRGDPLYDFSLGETPYKSLWTTGEQTVHRALWGSGSILVAARSRAWTWARSIDWLRRMKLQGANALLSGPQESMDDVDAPGLPVGPLEGGYAYRVPVASDHGSLRAGSYAEMRVLLSPRLLALAIERGFRGDQMMILEHAGQALGVVWRATGPRRPAVAGPLAPQERDAEVLYHPIPTDLGEMDQLVSKLPTGPTTVVVTSCPLMDPRMEELGRFGLDTAIWGPGQPDRVRSYRASAVLTRFLRR